MFVAKRAADPSDGDDADATHTTKRRSYVVDYETALLLVVEWRALMTLDSDAVASPYVLSLVDVLHLSSVCSSFRRIFYTKLLALLPGFTRATCTLNAEQMQVADRVLRKAQSVAIVGGGGCGKTTTFNAIISELEERKVKFVRCAPTGVAASHINGITIHQLFGFKPVGDTVRIKNGWQLRLALRDARVVLIDEMSMISADMFRLMNERLNRLHSHDLSVRGKPFGGVQLVMCGDPFQLPPIVKDTSVPANADQPRYMRNTPPVEVCYNSTLFHDVFGAAGVVFLYRSMRQRNDNKFTALLNDVRIGQYSMETTRTLKSRFISADAAAQLHASHTFLFCKRDRVAAHNAACLAALPGLPVTWTAIDRYYLDADEEERERLLEGNTTLETTLTLKVGARVLLTINADLSRRLVNGARGTVIDIRTACELGIDLCPPEHACQYCSQAGWVANSCRRYDVLSTTWTKKRAKEVGAEMSRFAMLPVVKFESCDEPLIVMPHFFEIQKGSGGGKRRRKDIPSDVLQVLARGPADLHDAVVHGDVKYRIIDGVPCCLHRRRFDCQCPECMEAGTFATTPESKAAGLCRHNRQLAQQCEICHAKVSICARRNLPSDEVVAMRIQLALLQADALTAHRAQGMTLPNVCFGDPYSVFQPGQAYVVLSRVPTLSGISIVGDSVPYDRMCPPPQALEFYKRYGGTLGDGLAIVEGRERVAKMDEFDWD